MDAVNFRVIFCYASAGLAQQFIIRMIVVLQMSFNSSFVVILKLTVVTRTNVTDSDIFDFKCLLTFVAFINFGVLTVTKPASLNVKFLV